MFRFTLRDGIVAEGTRATQAYFRSSMANVVGTDVITAVTIQLEERSCLLYEQSTEHSCESLLSMQRTHGSNLPAGYTNKQFLPRL